MNTKIKLFFLVLFIHLFTIVSGYSEDFNIKGTFFEPVKKVLIHKMRGSAAKKKGVYIPYTRIDLAVQNGIEIMRVIQTYKNNTKKNLGYNFTLPLQPDTTISQFTLWDHGKRLVASIEARDSAEKAYKEITGDEAPDFDKDPGLVRKSANMFNLRIFPITPDENKQMELVTHRRLGIEDNYFMINLPVKRLSQTRDDKGNSYAGKNNEVSVFLTDTLPIKEIILPDKAFTKINLGKNRWMIKARLAANQCDNFAIKYKVDLRNNSHIQPTFFSEDGKNYILMRVLSKWKLDHRVKEINKKQVSSEKKNKKSFYIGVWRNDHNFTKDNFRKSMKPDDLMLEFLAFFSLLLSDRSQYIVGSYSNFADQHKDKKEYRPMSIFSNQPIKLIRANQIGGAKAFSYKWRGGATEHLISFLKKGSIDNVILFMEQLPHKDKQKVISLIKQYPKINFIFIFPKNIDRQFKPFQNVSLYSIKKGWQQIHHPYRPVQLINFWDEVFVDQRLNFFSSFSKSLIEIAEKLPVLEKNIPSYQLSGDVGLKKMKGYFPGLNKSKKMKVSDLYCMWLSGNFKKQGKMNLAIQFADPDKLFNFNRINQPLFFFNVSSELYLKTGLTSNRFVGSYYAKHEVDKLSRQIRELRGISFFNRRRQPVKKLTSAQKKQIINLKKDIVNLSKKFSFLSSETAFIALPADLQKKYGYSKQQYDTGQLYNLKDMKKGGLPEPEEYILFFIILTIIVIFIIRKRRQLKQV